jgi:hypothetical protein
VVLRGCFRAPPRSCAIRSLSSPSEDPTLFRHWRSWSKTPLRLGVWSGPYGSPQNLPCVEEFCLGSQGRQAGRLSGCKRLVSAALALRCLTQRAGGGCDRLKGRRRRFALLADGYNVVVGSTVQAFGRPVLPIATFENAGKTRMRTSPNLTSDYAPELFVRARHARRTAAATCSQSVATMIHAKQSRFLARDLRAQAAAIRERRVPPAPVYLRQSFASYARIRADVLAAVVRAGLRTC